MSGALGPEPLAFSPGVEFAVGGLDDFLVVDQPGSVFLVRVEVPNDVL